MPRPRKPSVLHLLNGTLAHDAKRFADRADEPVDHRPLGDPPKYFKARQRDAWHEIAERAPWLRAADAIAVEIAAALLEQFRRSGIGLMQPAKLTRLETMLGRLGLTPSDRSKVSVRPTTPQNKFARFGTRMGDSNGD